MLKKKIQSNQIEALKAGKSKELETLRYILAQIKNKEIDVGHELGDDEVLAVLKKVAKELKESIASFEESKRTDLIANSKAQLAIVSSYLPEEISDDELKKEIQTIIDKNKDLFEKNPKAIIGIAMKELKSKADSQRIIEILRSYEK